MLYVCIGYRKMKLGKRFRYIIFIRESFTESMSICSVIIVIIMFQMHAKKNMKNLQKTMLVTAHTVMIVLSGKIYNII